MHINNIFNIVQYNAQNTYYQLAKTFVAATHADWMTAPLESSGTQSVNEPNKKTDPDPRVFDPKKLILNQIWVFRFMAEW